MNAFILAAGYGERLRPITNNIPKPLLPILGRPILEIVLDRIIALSPKVIGINMHHQWEKIREFVETLPLSDRIQLFHETGMLGTGGALFNARALLKESACIVHNADILTDIDLKELLKKHHESNNIATLAIHDYVKFNNVWIDKTGSLKCVGSGAKKESSGLMKVAFMGVAVYSPAFLAFLPEGNSSVVDAWLRAVNRVHYIGTVDFSGSEWTDIGTPDAYAEAVFDALTKDGEVVYIHNSVDCSRLEVGGNVVIEEGASVSDKIAVHDSILLPGASISGNRTIDHRIEGAGFSIKIGTARSKETISLEAPFMQWFGNLTTPLNHVPIGSGGSDRQYYRLNSNDRTAILMRCSTTDLDYNRQIAYTRFFSACSLPVPEILVADAQNKQALFEDLGDISLYSYLKCRRSPHCIEAMYKKVLDIAVMLHTEATARIAECPLLQERIFDYAHLRWETSYFLEHFVLGIKEVTISNENETGADFDNLAVEVDAYHKTIVHRDFQSQNIMIAKGDNSRLIDYQGARIGPPAYDIASMLWDPYVRIDDSMRDDLLAYYIRRVTELRYDFDETEFIRSLLLCRLQRHMQALGAYGFLAKVRGKRYFLKHATVALEYLKEESTLTKEDYPALHDLIARFT